MNFDIWVDADSVPRNLFHIDPKLGGDEGYARMIGVLHDAGIKVITDISINHTGTDHPWFKSASEGGPEEEYYYRNRRGGFDCWFNVKTLPQLNYNSEKLRSIIYRDEGSVLQKFLRKPFLQDGWRLDVATSVGNHKNERMCHEIWKEVRLSLKAVNRQTYLVGEDWDDPEQYLKGDQWDASMNYAGCSRPLRRWMGERDRFFWQADNRPGKVPPYSARQLRGHIEGHLMALEGQMVFQQMNLIDSHDIPRLQCHSETFDRSLFKGAVMMQFMLPGMPSIYYGDEIGIEGDDLIMIDIPKQSAELSLTCDGHEVFSLIEGDEISVSQSSHRALFVKNPGRSFIEVLRDKLSWAGGFNA